MSSPDLAINAVEILWKSARHFSQKRPLGRKNGLAALQCLYTALSFVMLPKVEIGLRLQVIRLLTDLQGNSPVLQREILEQYQKAYTLCNRHSGGCHQNSDSLMIEMTFRVISGFATFTAKHSNHPNMVAKLIIEGLELTKKLQSKEWWIHFAFIAADFLKNNPKIRDLEVAISTPPNFGNDSKFEFIWNVLCWSLFHDSRNLSTILSNLPNKLDAFGAVAFSAASFCQMDFVSMTRASEALSSSNSQPYVCLSINSDPAYELVNFCKRSLYPVIQNAPGNFERFSCDTSSLSPLLAHYILISRSASHLLDGGDMAEANECFRQAVSIYRPTQGILLQIDRLLWGLLSVRSGINSIGTAKDLFDAVIASSTESFLRDQARLALAVVRLLEGQIEEAQQALQDYQSTSDPSVLIVKAAASLQKNQPAHHSKSFLLDALKLLNGPWQNIRLRSLVLFLMGHLYSKTDYNLSLKLLLACIDHSSQVSWDVGLAAAAQEILQQVYDKMGKSIA